MLYFIHLQIGKSLFHYLLQVQNCEGREDRGYSLHNHMRPPYQKAAKVQVKYYENAKDTPKRPSKKFSDLMKSFKKWYGSAHPAPVLVWTDH
jgi:hypothetical protein